MKVGLTKHIMDRKVCEQELSERYKLFLLSLYFTPHKDNLQQIVVGGPCLRFNDKERNLTYI